MSFSEVDSSPLTPWSWQFSFQALKMLLLNLLFCCFSLRTKIKLNWMQNYAPNATFSYLIFSTYRHWNFQTCNFHDHCSFRTIHNNSSTASNKSKTLSQKQIPVPLTSLCCAQWMRITSKLAMFWHTLCLVPVRISQY